MKKRHKAFYLKNFQMQVFLFCLFWTFGCVGAFSQQIISAKAIENNYISSGQTICSGTKPLSLIGSVPASASGLFSYSWLSSTSGENSGYGLALGISNAINYDPSTLLQSTWFRRVVISGTSRDTSNAVLVMVNPLPSHILSSTGNSCMGDATLLISGGETAAISSIQWQLNGSTVSTVNATPQTGVAMTSVTVAGGYINGSDANQLTGPSGVFVDANHNMYISDMYNHRIQKWAPNATEGITVAGGNGQGSAANQLSYPRGVCVDASGNVYVADAENYRIQKWSPGAVVGVTVAGGNGGGSAANQFSTAFSVSVDAAGNVYVADVFNVRIQKWAPGSTVGVTVAGGHGWGSDANQLNNPCGVFVDGENNVYVSDTYNHRIQKWAPGATVGITVAGGNGMGSESNQFSYPFGVYADANGNVFVADRFNHRIQKWANGATTGGTLVGGNGMGIAQNQLNQPNGLFLDGSGDVYVADTENHRIQKSSVISTISLSHPATSAGTYTAIITNSLGCSSASNPVTIRETPTMPTLAVTHPTCASAYGTIRVTSTVFFNSFSIDRTNFSNLTGVFSGLPAGIYNVWVKNAAGCISAPFTIVVNPQPATPAAPVVTLTQPSCTLSTGTISVNNYVENLYYSTNSFTYLNTTGVFTGMVSGSYNLTAKNAAGCISPATPVVINPRLTIPTTPSATVTHPTCTLAFGTIKVSSPSSLYSYSISGNNVTFNSPNGIFSDLLSGTYSLRAISNAGCTSSAKSIVVNAQPATPAAPTLSLTQPTTTVGTGTIKVTSTVFGNSFSIYSYSTNNSSGFTNLTGVFSGLVWGEYSISARSSAGCISLPSQALIGGFSRATPVAPAEETSPVTATNPTAALPSVTEKSNSIVPAAMASELFEVGAYPNPSNTDFRLSISSASSETIRVTVYDMFGRAVKYFSFASKPSITLGQDLKAGVYMVELRQGKNVKTLKLVKF